MHPAITLRASFSQPADPIEPEIYLQFRTRRIGSGYHVIALGHGLEHVHHRPFATRAAAWRLLLRIRRAYVFGRHLDAAHWQTVPVSSIGPYLSAASGPCGQRAAAVHNE